MTFPDQTSSLPIQGCTPTPIRASCDDRGCLSEIFRQEWNGAFPAVQWNVCQSGAGVMRGVHVHAHYDEFYTLASGRVFIALRDIRRQSPTFGVTTAFEWQTTDGIAIPIPAGVAHALYFLEPSMLVFGLSRYWAAELDTLGCHWRELDPALPWPASTASVSARDSAAGSLARMIADYEQVVELVGSLPAASPSR
jgi:dTDP-4-dehydrorhamnose 3,5-epimerase